MLALLCFASLVSPAVVILLQFAANDATAGHHEKLLHFFL